MNLNARTQTAFISFNTEQTFDAFQYVNKVPTFLILLVKKFREYWFV